jgi:hypothetical protein
VLIDLNPNKIASSLDISADEDWLRGFSLEAADLFE